MKESFLESPVGILTNWIWKRIVSTQLNGYVQTFGPRSQQLGTKGDERKNATVDDCVRVQSDQQADRDAPIQIPSLRTEAQRWSLTKRVLVAGVICLYTFVVYAASAIYVIGMPEIMHEFQLREQEALLGLSVYVLAYGLGPLIWAPLSELNFVGRSPVYAATFVAFLCFSVLVSMAKSWPAFLVLRFFQAFFGSPCLANGGASMHDLFPESAVPYALTVWISAAYCGPALGPLLAGYVVPEKGWRFGMWEIVYMAGPVCFLVLFLPETYEPTIQQRRAGTKVCEQEHRDLSQSNRKQRTRPNLIISAIVDAVVKPIQICVLDPAIAVANLYTSFIYGTYYTLFDALPRVYPVKYGFDAGELGLAFLSVFAACIVGGLVYSVYVYKVLNPALRRGGMQAHEDRLRPALVACFLPPIGLFLFGWTSDGGIHWLVSLAGIIIYAMGTFVILQCISVYLPRIYPEYSASLFASNDFCRSSLATAAIHFGVPLYGNLGVARGVSILGGLSIFGVAGLWFIYWKGASLRAQSRFVTARAL